MNECEGEGVWISNRPYSMDNISDCTDVLWNDRVTFWDTKYTLLNNIKLTHN